MENELDEKLQDIVIDKDNMNTPAAYYAIGQLVVQCLQSGLKRAGAFIDEFNSVKIANPVYVYFDPRALYDSNINNFKKVRPIITDGKPILVMTDENGKLWEVEEIK